MTINQLHTPFGLWGLCTPPVYRYLKNPQWVDDFWNTGTIRLAAFEQFRTHPDELRRDEAEAWFGQEQLFSPAAAAAAGPSATPIYTFQSGHMGPCCYVLCTSILRDLAKFGPAFISIGNTTSFGLEIARQLPGFVQGWEGLCLYGHRRYTTTSIGADEAAAILSAVQAGQPPPPRELSPDLMFAKRAKHAPELEYRFIWEVDHRVTEAISAVAPQARNACVRPESTAASTGGDGTT